MTDDEINRAAASDPDNPPLTDTQLAQFRQTALARKVRHKLHMSRESFADAFGIPLDKLRAWERHEAEPTEVEMVYLRLIERAPELAKVQPVPA